MVGINIDTDKNWSLLIDISKVNNRSEMKQGDLAEELGFAETNSTFTNLVNYLIEKKGISCKYGMGRSKILTINHKRIFMIIRSTQKYHDVTTLIKEMQPYASAFPDPIKPTSI